VLLGEAGAFSWAGGEAGAVRQGFFFNHEWTLMAPSTDYALRADALVFFTEGNGGNKAGRQVDFTGGNGEN